MGRPLKIVSIALASAIIFLVAVGWYALHNPDRFLPRIKAEILNKTGLQVEIKHVSLRLLPMLAVRVYGLEVKNPKPFPPGDFLNVPSLEVTLELTPLLHRQIVIRTLALNGPTIDFISDPDGLWNFQNPASSKHQPEDFSMGSVSDLQVRNGTLLGSNLIDPADTPGPVVLELRNVSGELKQTEFHSRGHSGLVHAIQGNLTAGKARFGVIHTSDLRSQVRISPRQLTFKNFNTTTYRGKASGDLSFYFGAKNTTFQSNMQVSGIGMPYLLAEFGAASKREPKMTGMMQAKLGLTGQIEHSSNPLAEMHGAGNITIDHGELPSLNRNKSMKEMERFRSPGASSLPPSAFSSFAGDMELKNHRIYSRRIAIDFYGIDVDGSGSMSVAGGPLDYRGAATILKKQGFFTDTFARWFKGAKEKTGRLTFPIRLTGTLADPKFSVVD
ncbi:MAG: AsmA family protein [Acidobacteriaceae bacterium]